MGSNLTLGTRHFHLLVRGWPDLGGHLIWVFDATWVWKGLGVEGPWTLLPDGFGGDCGLRCPQTAPQRNPQRPRMPGRPMEAAVEARRSWLE